MFLLYLCESHANWNLVLISNLLFRKLEDVLDQKTFQPTHVNLFPLGQWFRCTYYVPQSLMCDLSCFLVMIY